MSPSVKHRCKCHNARYCNACPPDVGLNPDGKDQCMSILRDQSQMKFTMKLYIKTDLNIITSEKCTLPTSTSTHCSVWLWNLLSHINGRTQIESVWKYLDL